MGRLRGGCDDPLQALEGQAASNVSAGEGSGGGGGGGGGDSIRSDSSGAVFAASVNLGSSLVQAASEGNLEQVEKLLIKGARVNALHIPPPRAGVKPSGSTALHAAAEHGSAAVAQHLLRHGALVNARDRDGSTPLHRAAYWGRYELIGALIEHGADLAAQDADGMSPLHNAAIHGKAQVLGGLVAAVRVCLRELVGGLRAWVACVRWCLWVACVRWCTRRVHA